MINANEELLSTGTIMGEPLQHEDMESFTLRITYEQALREVKPDLDDATIMLIAMMVIKKARYGVVYEPEVEDLIQDLNQEIQKYYSN
jgi:hypothetical protein